MVKLHIEHCVQHGHNNSRRIQISWRNLSRGIIRAQKEYKKRLWGFVCCFLLSWFSSRYIMQKDTKINNLKYSWSLNKSISTTLAFTVLFLSLYRFKGCRNSVHISNAFIKTLLHFLLLQILLKAFLCYLWKN